MVTAIVTGFEPFGVWTGNPSGEIAELLDGEKICGARIIGITLPVSFGKDVERLFPVIREERPALVLSLGLNGGIACLHVERMALNSRIADDGSRELPIIEGAPAAYNATIDVERVAAAIAERGGAPAQPHPFGGNYLCNHLLYQTLHFTARNDWACKAGFIHLPLSLEQVLREKLPQMPSLPLAAMISGVRAAIENILGAMDSL